MNGCHLPNIYWPFTHPFLHNIRFLYSSTMVDLTALPRSSLQLNSTSGWSMFVGILLICPPVTLQSNLSWFWLYTSPHFTFNVLHLKPHCTPLRSEWTAPKQFIFPAVISLNTAEQKLSKNNLCPTPSTLLVRFPTVACARSSHLQSGSTYKDELSRCVGWVGLGWVGLGWVRLG
jgi:hypothetical protein